MLTTALILGFAGSLHCVGMCSPLAFAVTNKSGILNKFLYNVGRILMYCLLGAIVSSIGVILPVYVQYTISITLGVALLVIGITGSNFKIPLLTPLIRVTSFIKNQFSKSLQQKGPATIFTMGLLNGLLPCGLTFLALTACITLNGPLGGFIFMAAFGAGTLPVMLGLVSIIPFFAKHFNFNVAKLSVAMQLVAGCLLIVRVLLVDPGAHQPVTGLDQITICP
jgi:sulfite exporter TauE/SafE